MKKIKFKEMASISVATYLPLRSLNAPTPCFIICLIRIRVVLEHGSVAKATTAGGIERRERDSEEIGKG